jgi:hypothetical protein
MPTVTDLTALVERLAEAIPDLNLDGDEQDEYSTMLQWLQNQVETGEPAVSLAFLRACREIGIANFRLHDLRHTAASWMRMSGADLQDVADILGHRDLQMTKRYAHLSGGHRLASVKRLDTVFAPPQLAHENSKSSHILVTSEGENGTQHIQTSARMR